MPKIFLSYAHLDNQVPKEWVSNFTKELDKYAKVYSGKRDLEISNNVNNIYSKEVRTEVIETRIKEELDNSDILIALISPCYLESWWGAFEREYFLRFVLKEKEKDIELRKSKILNVVKLMLTSDDIKRLTRELKCIYSYNFCKFNEGKAVTVRPEEPAFEDTLIDIATSIAIKLRPKETDKHLRIFVGKTSEDMLLKTNRLITELEAQKGFTAEIVTSGNFGEPLQEQKKDIEDLIRSCHFSIHIFGTGEGQDISMFQWQTVAACVQEGTTSVRMISWISQELQHDTTGSTYASFVHGEVMNFNSLHHDYLTKSFEDLLTNVKEQLNNLQCQETT